MPFFVVNMKNNSQRNHNSAGSKYPFNKRQKEIERQKKENPNQSPNKR
jgi:hypothetical protein